MAQGTDISHFAFTIFYKSRIFAPPFKKETFFDF